MSIRDLLGKNRSVRRYEEGFRIEKAALVELVELTRLPKYHARLAPGCW